MKLFSYGALLSREVQLRVLKEPVEGIPGQIVDYEMHTFPRTTVPYIEKRYGASVSGKMFNLTDEQSALVDAYMGGGYKKISLSDNEHGTFYVHVRGDK